MKKLILFSIVFCFALAGIHRSLSLAEDNYEEPKPNCQIGQFCFCFPKDDKYLEYGEVVEDDYKKPGRETVCTRDPIELAMLMQELVATPGAKCGKCQNDCDKYYDNEDSYDDYCGELFSDAWYGEEDNWDSDWEWTMQLPEKRNCNVQEVCFCVLPHDPDYDYKYLQDNEYTHMKEPTTVCETIPGQIRQLEKLVCQGKALPGACEEPSADDGSQDDGGGDSSGDSSGTSGDNNGNTTGGSDGSTTGSTQEIPVSNTDALSGSGCSLSARSTTPYAATTLLLLVPIAVAGLLRKKPSA